MSRIEWRHGGILCVAITLKFITTVALYLQLLTLVYLYSDNRARFFRYLVWAWGLFVVSKGSYVIQHFFPQAGGVIPLLNAAGSAGDLLILAAGLAYRGDYRIRSYHAAVGVAYAVLSSLLSSRKWASRCRCRGESSAAVR